MERLDAWCALLAMGVAAACAGDRDVTREYDVREQGDERSQLASPASDVVLQLKELDRPDLLVYDPPTPLARPAGVVQWPPAATPTSPRDTARAAGAADTAAAAADTAATRAARPDTTRRDSVRRDTIRS